MRTIAGAILILAGVVGFGMGTMLDSADWFRNRDSPSVMLIGGGASFVLGAGILVWGLAKDG